MAPARPETRDQECVRFLQWALPRLGYRWPGFRKVRRQVCRRVRRRAEELGLPDLSAYRRQLEREEAEWRRLDRCCGVTISRFYRDHGVWRVLEAEVLPELFGAPDAGRSGRLRAWSAGAGAGEEPYTLALLLALGSVRPPAGWAVEIVATDRDARQLERARQGVYPASSLRDLPPAWRRRGFVEAEGGWRLRGAYRQAVELRRQDLRRQAPEGPFDLLLCRNLAFTYFDRQEQRRCLDRLLSRLRPGGWLAVGSHESPPDTRESLRPHPRERSWFRRR